MNSMPVSNAKVRASARAAGLLPSIEMIYVGVRFREKRTATTVQACATNFPRTTAQRFSALLTPHSARTFNSPSSPSKLPARASSYASFPRARLVVDLGTDHAVHYSFRIGLLLRESPLTDLFHLSSPQAFKEHPPAVPFICP